MATTGNEPTGVADGGEPAAEEQLRAGIYDLLAAVLRREPEAGLIGELTTMKGEGDSALFAPIRTIAHLAGTLTPGEIGREYTDLFIGVGRGELVPYASFYLTGFLNEKPLADLRADMANLGMARSAETRDPEDHIASLCEMLAGMILGRFLEPAPLQLQRAFFDRHLAPWAGFFFADLEKARASRFYVPVGTLGRVFLEIEGKAFEMQA